MRGSQDAYNDDLCPKCGAMYCADGDAPNFPVPPDHKVKCLGCGHPGDIQDWWDAFDNYHSRLTQKGS